MSKLSVLMTVYNEAEFVDYAIRACEPHVDHVVVVEGAYQETIALGAEPRSTDGTIEKIEPHWAFSGSKVHYKEANEQTDKDQRNVGLEIIKKLNPDGWCLIIDGDEVYDKSMLDMVKVSAYNMDKQNKLAAYFRSLTFVNDLGHYTEQDFPRLFKITPKCKFVNDNFMEWPDRGVSWFSPYVMKIPYVRYHHYAFCKGLKRFELKKKWWETRFEEDFDYGWHMRSDGKIDDENHQIYEYTGKHPEIMKDHPAWRMIYGDDET
jgi:glycosyltransferase involved in cell wall biosynthesis